VLSRARQVRQRVQAGTATIKYTIIGCTALHLAAINPPICTLLALTPLYCTRLVGNRKVYRTPTRNWLAARVKA
jgi:hypothetical protein